MLVKSLIRSWIKRRHPLVVGALVAPMLPFLIPIFLIATIGWAIKEAIIDTWKD